VTAGTRPAFYALAPGGWRDYVTLLHPPYTAWHLSYAAIGAALAPQLDWERLVLALAAFFLGMGVGAHALDELRGRPLQTRIPDRVLWGLAAVSIAVAVSIGLLASVAAERLSDEAVAAALFAALLSWAQRILSTPVRNVRRRVASVAGTVSYRDGREERIDASSLMGAPETALRVLAAANVALAIALVLRHLG
jgi:hypothetical protein